MKRFIMIFFCMVSVICVDAQNYNFDGVFIEASINFHVKNYARLAASAILEEAKAVQHNKVDSITFSYKTLCDSLELYNKAFGWIEAVYTGLKTVYLVKTTYTNVKDKSEAIFRLMEDYYEKCLKNGRVSTSDTLIYGIGKRAAEKIYDDCKYIYDSYSELVMYAAGMKCTTERLISMLDNIDDSMSRLGKDLDLLYFQLHKYIVSRTHMWKHSYSFEKTKAEHATEALARWRSSLYRGSGLSRN